MRDDLSGLSALLAVAEKRSFTRASAELGVTPSAVSQTIRLLEERVGVRLLQRTTRSVGLTEAGERFVSRLKPALEGVKEAYESIGELRDRPTGVLRLDIPRVGYDHVLEPILASFLETYPEIELELAIDDRLANIVDQGFDAGIRLGETLEREMIALAVSEPQRAAVVGAPAYFERHPRPLRPSDLASHDCINFRQLSRGSIYRWEFTQGGKDFEVAVRGRITTNDGRLMVRAATQGHGLAYVLESMVTDELADGRLIGVLESFCPPFPGYFLYYPSRSHLAPKLQALIDFLKEARRRSRSSSAARSTVARRKADVARTRAADAWAASSSSSANAKEARAAASARDRRSRSSSTRTPLAKAAKKR